MCAHMTAPAWSADAANKLQVKWPDESSHYSAPFQGHGSALALAAGVLIQDVTDALVISFLHAVTPAHAT